MIERIKARSRLVDQWVQQFFITATACSIYVLAEWIFIATKPSLLNQLSLGENILVAAKGLILAAAFAIFCLLIPGIISILTGKKAGNAILIASSIIPSFVAGSLFLMLFDNFTYTVFKFGIITSSGPGRILYAASFLGLVYLAIRCDVLLLSLKIRHAPAKLALLGLTVIAFFFVIPAAEYRIQVSAKKASPSLPNIILIGSDGLSADHMSLYGYERETTPYLEEFAKDALLVQNDFSNSSNTSASVISILTGRYPAQTRVIYPPDMLTGSAAIAHLPGILKSLGYYSAEFTLPHYADAYTLGMQYGFDEVNGESEATNSYLVLRESGFETSDAYFLSTAFDRISQRILHIIFIHDAQNPYDFVKKGLTELTDPQIVDSLLSFLDSHQGSPVFVHAHLIGTHGEKFQPPTPKFSVGETQDKPWMTDFYDDSILTFDSLVGEMVESLKTKGQLENSIIIIYADHGEQWQDQLRIPLVIRFPDSQYKDVAVNQAQNLDIAPTILDYLDVSQPAWMDGRSLLDSDYRNDLVISTATTHSTDNTAGEWVLDTQYLKPPFNQFDYVLATQCQNQVKLNLETYEITTGTVDNYANPCPESSTMSSKEMLNSIINHLITHGFTIPAEVERTVANFQ